MLVIAHRGDHHRAPENTLRAFEKAVALGVDGIETDIRRTRDGEAVLFHDRVAGGCEVASMHRAELSEIVGYPVPTLGEALHAFDGILWVLEVKTQDAIDPVVSTLRGHRSARRCIVISFWHDVVEEVLARVPVQGGLLLSHRPVDCRQSILSQIQHASIRHLVWNYEFLDPRVTELTSECGYVNLAYGPSSPAEHLHRARIGLDAVITDSIENVRAISGGQADLAPAPPEIFRPAEAAL